MKTTFKFYAFLWAIGFVIFNLITFLPVVSTSSTEILYSFIVSYLFCDVMFITQLGCGYFALKTENKQKVFYNIPLLTTSFISLVTTIVVSIVLAVIPDIPNWLTALVLVIITLFSVVSILKANFVSEEVSKLDEKIKVNTNFIKSLTAEAEALLLKATTEEAKTEVKKVYDAIRYSDPISNSLLASLESEILIKFKNFENVVKSNNSCYESANELLILIEERNNKNKILK